MARIDQIEKHYKASETLDLIANILFYVLAFTAILIALIQQSWVKELASIAFVALVVVYFIVKHAATLFFMPNAERIRRKQLLSDSFSVPLVHEKTQEYYNNSIPPSHLRLGANVCESAFFSHRILAKMLVFERLKLVTFFTVWVIALVYRGLSQEIVIIISQTIFSAEVIARWAGMELLRTRTCEVYNDMYKFILTKPLDNSESIALVLESFSHYESAKTAASIRLSSKIFNDMNPDLSAEWKIIQRQFNIEAT